MGTPTLLLQLALHNSNCSCCSRYLSSSTVVPPSDCFSCRTLHASCRQACHYRHAAPNYTQNPPYRHSHSAHDSSSTCCSSNFFDLAACSDHEQQAAAQLACDRHSQEAPYFCSTIDAKNAMTDQPLITVAAMCKTAPAAPGFCADQSQEELAAEMKWWERGLRRSTSSSYGQEEPLHCYTWPPRSYSCTFCRRMFTSAQALGGHMNVHRHERARLRQYSQPATAASINSYNAQAASTGVPLPAFYMHNDMPCFNYSSTPIMMSSSNGISSSSLQHGPQETKIIGEERRKKFLQERSLRDEKIHVAPFLIDNQNKQEVACVDLELRLGSLASN